jgi:hypothetical protein
MSINYDLIKPGDAGFAVTKNLYGRLIQFGQALRWWKYRQWHHMFIVDEVDPTTGTIWVIQMARKCERVKIENVAPGGHVKIVPAPTDIDANRAIEWARKQIGTEYGYITIASIAVNICLPDFFQIDILKDGTLICSALVARAWEHGGWDCPVNPFNITPAEFDGILGDAPGQEIY